MSVMFTPFGSLTGMRSKVQITRERFAMPDSLPLLALIIRY